LPDGVPGKFSNALDFPFHHELGAMSFYGLDADVKFVGYLTGSLAFGQKLQDL
jgi:hypothetical protein